MTAQQLAELSERDFISHIWGNAVLEAIDRQTTAPMTMDQFLDHCTACGSNWGGMLLTGLKELYPEVYDAIPDNMGMLAWRGICDTLTLLNIQS
jgi:hypothetical protein